MVTGIDGLKMRSNGYAGTWLLLQSESQVKKLRMLPTIYSMDYPDLVNSVELARRLAKEEARRAVHPKQAWDRAVYGRGTCVYGWNKSGQ